jgi:hypothetical protein
VHCCVGKQEPSHGLSDDLKEVQFGSIYGIWLETICLRQVTLLCHYGMMKLTVLPAKYVQYQQKNTVLELTLGSETNGVQTEKCQR